MHMPLRVTETIGRGLVKSHRVWELRCEEIVVPGHESLKNGHYAVRYTPLYEMLRKEKRCRTGSAVGVDVLDGNSGETEFIDGTLATCRIPVTIANARLLYRVVGYGRIIQRLRRTFLDHVEIVPFLRERLLELGHSDTNNKHLLTHDHFPLLGLLTA